MPKKISVVKKREWLQEFEDGKQIISIAKKNKKDTRTVKKGIDDARREQDATRAVSDMLAKALRKHHDSLLEAVREIIPVLMRIPSNLSLPWRGQDDSLSVHNFKFQYTILPEPKVLKVTLESESKPEWELLTEHLRRDTFIIEINRWKRAVANYLQARMVLEQALARMLMERTSCLFLDKSYEHFPENSKPKPPFISPFLVTVLSQYIVEKLTQELATNVSDQFAISEPNKITYWQNGPMLLQKEGKASECRDKITSLVEETLKSPEALNVLSTYQEMIEASAKAASAAQELLLLDFVPGRCRICHKIGL
jgi:hypothetical protein